MLDPKLPTQVTGDQQRSLCCQSSTPMGVGSLTQCQTDANCHSFGAFQISQNGFNVPRLQKIW